MIESPHYYYYYLFLLLQYMDHRPEIRDHKILCFFLHVFNSQSHRIHSVFVFVSVCDLCFCGLLCLRRFSITKFAGSNGIAQTAKYLQFKMGKKPIQYSYYYVLKRKKLPEKKKLKYFSSHT